MPALPPLPIRGEIAPCVRFQDARWSQTETLSAAALPGSAPTCVLNMEVHRTLLPSGSSGLDIHVAPPGRTAPHTSAFRRHIGAELGTTEER